MRSTRFSRCYPHLGLPKEDLDAALTHLLQEEYITQQDGYLML